MDAGKDWTVNPLSPIELRAHRIREYHRALLDGDERVAEQFFLAATRKPTLFEWLRYGWQMLKPRSYTELKITASEWQARVETYNAKVATYIRETAPTGTEDK